MDKHLSHPSPTHPTLMSLRRCPEYLGKSEINLWRVKERELKQNRLSGRYLGGRGGDNSGGNRRRERSREREGGREREEMKFKI